MPVLQERACSNLPASHAELSSRKGAALCTQGAPTSRRPEGTLISPGTPGHGFCENQPVFSHPGAVAQKLRIHLEHLCPQEVPSRCGSRWSRHYTQSLWLIPLNYCRGSSKPCL